MKAVIVTSRLGYGHTRAGEAVAAALGRLDGGAEVEMLDFWSLMAPKVSAALKATYLRLVSEDPEAYERLYQITELEWQECFRSGRLPPPLDELARDLVAGQFPEAGSRLPLGGVETLDETLFVALLRRFLAERQRAPGRVIGWGLALGLRALLMARLLHRLEASAPDALIATQMLPATLLSYIRDNGELVEVPSFGVLTDYGVHDFWARSGLDWLCVPHPDLAEVLAEREAVGSRVVTTGMPLMPEFAEPPEPAAARRALGLAAGRPTLLVTGGAYGIGVRETLERLLAADPGWQIVATTGGGDERLDRLAGDHSGRLLMLDWCQDMARVMRAADLVVGKPGGLTVSEAMACGRPFFAACSLAGQEGHNVRFLERHGAGRLVESERLVDTLQGVLADGERLARMQRRALAAGRRDGAARIARLVAEVRDAGRPAARRAAP